MPTVIDIKIPVFHFVFTTQLAICVHVYILIWFYAKVICKGGTGKAVCSVASLTSNQPAFTASKAKTIDSLDYSTASLSSWMAVAAYQLLLIFLCDIYLTKTDC